MAKQQKTYYFDSYSGYRWSVEGDFSEEEVISYIKTNWLEPHDAIIKDINERNVLRNLALRYAHGEKHLTGRTAEARTEYSKLFNEKLLPKDQRRRVIDVISSRIKDILPTLATRLVVEDTISKSPNDSDSQIASRIYDMVVKEKQVCCPVPNTQFVKNIRAQMEKGGGTLPAFELDATTKFVLSVSDQLADVSRIEDNKIALDIHMKRKKARLVFALPHKLRYQVGKVSLPDIVRTIKNAAGIAFDFSIRHDAPQPYEPTCSLGADIGEIYPVVATLIGQDWHSQSFYPNGTILDSVDKLNDLAFQKAVLLHKIDQNSRPSRTMRPGQKLSFEELVELDEAECHRISGKMTDLKHEIARWAAHFICETAMSHHAQVALEKLNWSDPKHAFFHSLIQDAIENLAKVSGIPIVYVNAKGTSTRCPHEGEKLVQGVPEGPPAVRASSKQRNSWRHIERNSGLRDSALRNNVAKSAGVSPFEVAFEDVENARKDDADIKRGAKCPCEDIVRDHDAVGSMNIGVAGEVARGSRSSCYSLSSSSFRRVHRRVSDLRFGWAVSLSATAAVSASAPVTGLASVSNDAVGLVVGGSPPA